MKKYRKPLLLLSTVSFILFIACKKNSQAPSVQSLLQNRWLVLTQEYTYPTISYAAVNIYHGVSSDYDQFTTNDTLIISQAGSPNNPYYPFVSKHRYYLLNDTTIFLLGNPNQQSDTLKIQKISADSLILTSPIYITYLDTSRTIVTATGVNTIRLFR